MKLSYVLPDPASYRDWTEFEGDLACVKQAGYDAVELQIADPATFDEERVRKTLQAVGLPMCAFQTGTTYATRGNCLCTADDAVRERTVKLLRSFVELAARWQAVIVVGSLQGRFKEEPNRSAGEARIREALCRVGEYAVKKGATVAFEPVNHGEIGFHNTIAEAEALVRGIALPSVRLMVDSFHMNIEEKDMLAPLAGTRDVLAHVHLSETNRDVLGEGHWDTKGFLAELCRIGYGGYCSIGVYNTRRPRRDCMTHCMKAIENR
ncbi:MAG TPA: sugar phosphate isomerase/epimerase family protein [Planctomycetota bacterium]|nr:sugar phosphate isomerase/epimerase family protein [Planctomycetota bacterium]